MDETRMKEDISMCSFTRSLLCFSLAFTCLFGAAPAGEAVHKATLRVIQDSERMTLEGRDIFSYNSAEIYAMRRARGLTDDQEIANWGFVGDSMEENKGTLAFYFPLDGFEILAMINDSEARTIEEVAALLDAWRIRPADHVFPVAAVYVNAPGIHGPFGVEVGMAVEALIAALPDIGQSPVVGQDLPYDTALALYYVDSAPHPAGGDLYVLNAYAKDGLLVSFNAGLDWARDAFEYE